MWVRKGSLTSSVYALRVTQNRRISALTPLVSKISSAIDEKFGQKNMYAPNGYNNPWLMALPALAAQVTVGSILAWPNIADVLTKEVGFVTPHISDWSLVECTFPMYMAFMFYGSTSAFFGPWLIQEGPKKSLLCSSLSIGAGLMLGAVGVYTHTQPLLLMGCGVCSGAAIGMAFTSCTQTLMELFPNRKGFASGMSLAAFGSGALAFTPFTQKLVNYFAVMPEYLGPAKEFTVKSVDSKLFVDFNGKTVEVVEALSADIAKLPYDLAEGLYVVGSGSTGAAAALAVLGVSYSALLLGTALTIRKPFPGLSSASSIDKITGNTTVESVPAVDDRNELESRVHDVIRNPHFHLLSTSVACAGVGGVGVLMIAPPLLTQLSEVTQMPLPVSSLTTLFTLSGIGGALAWSSLSDLVNRRAVLALVTAGAIPLFGSIQPSIDAITSSTQESSMALNAIVASNSIAISFAAGVCAILPAYKADMFGLRTTGRLQGMTTLYAVLAALFGPDLLEMILTASKKSTVDSIAEKLSPEQFLEVFGNTLDVVKEEIVKHKFELESVVPTLSDELSHITLHTYDTALLTLTAVAATGSATHALVKSKDLAKFTEIVNPPGTQYPKKRFIDRRLKSNASGRKRVDS